MAVACKESKDGNMTLKQSVHHIANAVESLAMEACYDILYLPLTLSSIKKEFSMICRSDDWMFIVS